MFPKIVQILYLTVVKTEIFIAAEQLVFVDCWV